MSVSDGCLVAGSHPTLLYTELCGVLRSIASPPEEQIQQLLSSHEVHSNPGPAAAQEIREY